MDPADAHGAYAVGAIDQADWNLPDPSVEPYSSQGPTTDGRLKPDLVAPDGTTSLTYGSQQSFGTSFSSPTVAGGAALILEPNPALDPAGLAAALNAKASDLGPWGPPAPTPSSGPAS
jgi:subtilisin family serine protease